MGRARSLEHSFTPEQWEEWDDLSEKDRQAVEDQYERNKNYKANSRYKKELDD